MRVPPSLASLIRSLHPHIKGKLRGALAAIAVDSDCGKALREELSGVRSLRVGRFRLIYRVGSRRIIDLVAFGPRQTIYEETLRLVAADSAKDADAQS